MDSIDNMAPGDHAEISIPLAGTSSDHHVQSTASSTHDDLSFMGPPEIKEMILGYLLDADAVAYVPEYGAPSHSVTYTECGGTVPTYHFHTNILGVRKAVRDEAIAHFYKHNTFVLVNIVDCPGLLQLLHLQDVRIVAEYHTASFSHHAFTIQIFWPNNPYATNRYLQLPDPSGPRSCTFVMLFQDLPRFWSSLRFLCQGVNPPLCIASGQGQGLHIVRYYAPDEPSPYPWITISSHRGGNEDLNPLNQLYIVKENELLEQFRTVVGGGHHLVLLGFNNVALAQEIRHATSPRMVWHLAHMWDSFETMLQYKHEADRLLESNYCKAAQARYDFLLGFTRGVPFPWQIPQSLPQAGPPGSRLDPDISHLWRKRVFLAVELHLSSAWCHLKHGEEEAAQSQLYAIDMRLGTYVVPDIFGAWVEHLDTLTELMYRFQRPVGSADILISPYALTRYLHTLEALPFDRYIQHDIDLFREVTSQQNVSPMI